MPLLLRWSIGCAAAPVPATEDRSWQMLRPYIAAYGRVRPAAVPHDAVPGTPDHLWQMLRPYIATIYRRARPAAVPDNAAMVYPTGPDVVPRGPLRAG